jgi:3-methyladenine DNA glycosylase AlkD
MMDKKITAGAIFGLMERYGEENHNPARVEKYSRYFKEGYDAWGLDEGLLDQKVEWLMEQPGISYEMTLESSLLLVASPKYEMAACAFKLLLKFKKEWDLRLFQTIEQWFPIGITNWAHTDYLCSELMPWLFKKRIITLADLQDWRTSSWRFQRRAAVVSLIKPMKLEQDFSQYFDFIEPMMHDPERVVHQALGWFLREMWKKQPEPVEVFLLRFRDTAPRLIFQYATEKMKPEEKLKFRRQK